MKCPSALLGSLVFLLGCSLSLDDEAQKVLEKDPAFANVWQKKQAIRSQIASLEAQFKESQTGLESQINELRNQIKEHQKELEDQVHQLQVQLDPEREAILQLSRKVQGDLDSKKERLRQIQREIKQIEETIQQESDKSDLARQLSQLVIEREDLELQLKQLEEDLRLRKTQAHLIQSW